MPGNISRWYESAAVRVQHTVEERRFDSVVIVEVLDVSCARNAHTHVGVEVRSAMSRDGLVLRLSQSGDASPGRIPAAAGYVDLEAVDYIEHLGEVGLIEAVFTGRHVGAGSPAVRRGHPMRRALQTR